MSPAGIFLVWTLFNGEAVDVDAFLSKDSCEKFQVASEVRRAQSVAQHPDAAKYSFLGCQPVQVSAPPLAGERS